MSGLSYGAQDYADATALNFLLIALDAISPVVDLNTESKNSPRCVMPAIKAALTSISQVVAANNAANTGPEGEFTDVIDNQVGPLLSALAGCAASTAVSASIDEWLAMTLGQTADDVAETLTKALLPADLAAAFLKLDDLEEYSHAVESAFVILGSPFALSSTTTTSTTTPTQVSPTSWTDATSTVGTPPPARAESAMAYDAADGYTVLFGGESPSGAALGDTWVFNNGKWSQISPSKSPSPRWGEAMTYDAADGYTVLFGGYGCGGLCGDTWMFKAGQWTELRPSQAPSARAQPAMTYDSGEGYVLLFGGGNGGATVYGDTWVFKSGQWSEQASSTSPPARIGASLTDDERDGYVVMFGGSADAQCVCQITDTWTYSDGNWTQLSPSNAPSGRDGYGFAYDAAIGAAVFFGGWNANDGCGNTVGDTWDFSAGNWTELSLSSSPSARTGPAMDYDPQAGGIVLFGGDTGTCGAPGPTFSDTWELGATTITTVPDTTTLPPTTTTITVIPSTTGFLVVRQVNDSTLAPGFGTSGGSCGWPAGGQQVTPPNEADYVYIKYGGTISFDFSVAAGSSAAVTWEFPAGAELDQGTAQISVDGGSPITAGQDALGGYYSTTGPPLVIWSHTFGPGSHTIEWSASGLDVHVYGVAVQGEVTPIASPAEFDACG
ncbi:MAG: kelch repeat-containing protein [Acidimicrobiales bacterium]